MFLWAGYRGAERTIVGAGGDRAYFAAQQLAASIDRSAQLRRDQVGVVASDDAIRAYVQTPTEAHLEAARVRASSLATAVPYRIALWNVAGERLFEIAGPAPPVGDAAVPAVFPLGEFPTDVGSNALRTANDRIFSQTVAAVVAEAASPEVTANQPVPLGYLVVRAAVGNPREALPVDSFGVIARLVGAEATLAIGNRGGDVWTDLAHTIPAPPVDLTRDHVSEYERPGGDSHIGAIVTVPHTPWAVWVEFPTRALLAPARALLKHGIFLALACLAIGAGIVATVTARTTRPLGELAQAAHDIAAGNYARRVGTKSRNEIGELAEGFNLMAGRIEDAYGALQRANDQTQFALAAARMGVWEVDLETTDVMWSPATAAVFGLTPETAPRTVSAAMAHIHPDDHALVSEALTDPHDTVVEFRVFWPDQSIHWVNSRAQVLHYGNTKSGRRLGVITDITERKALEDALFAEKDRAQVTLHSIGDAVISTDVAGDITYLNAAAERLTKWSGVDAIGRSLLDVFDIVNATTRARADDPAALAMRLQKTVDLGGGNHLLIRRDGSTTPVEDSAAPIHDRDGHITGAVIVFRDVSAERSLALKMAHLAQYDVLTNLPNRKLLDDRISQATALARRGGTRLAVLFVDLDRFKHINDSLGHAIGDGLLQSVAARLLTCVRDSDTVSRRGGDEFVVLLSLMERSDAAGLVAEKIIAAVSAPHEIVEHVLHVSASIGISIYPDDALGAQALINAADAAMYHAKENGRGNYQFFTSQMNARSVVRRSLEGSLRKALQRQEFVLYYQPKISLTTSTMTGVEALVRWQHPTQGLLAPAEFIPIAEDSGLILPIGRWVLREACRQAQAWQAQGLPPRAMAVNVSAVEFRAKGFLDHVAAVLEETGLAPQYLEFEVTESVLMADADATTAVLHALKDFGTRLAIDDFGTGYSSLSYLSRFPIDTLKIDRSFVQGMTVAGHDATIINAIIGMGRSLNQCVVAEGVETADQLALLQSHLCGEGQGYYFGPPVPAEQLADRLRHEPRGLQSAPSCKHTSQ